MANKADNKVESRLEHRKQKQVDSFENKRYISLLLPIVGGLIILATAIFYVYPKIMNEGDIHPKNVSTKAVEDKKVQQDKETEKKVEVKSKEVVKEPKKETKEVEKEKQSKEYLLPDSNLRKLTSEDLSHLSKSDLRIARNEIYARHGFVFKSSDLTIYFTSKSWYSPNPAYNGALSDVEKYNLNFIQSKE